MWAIVAVLIAAALFGAGTPVCKRLTGAWDPVLLAGALYFASGVGLFLARLAVRGGSPLERGDLGWLAGAVAFGGVGAPVALLTGLTWTTGHAGALLLNLETVFTAGIAVLLFRQRLAASDGIPLALLVLGACAVGVGTAEAAKDAPRPLAGAALVALACLGWGFDNNFTQKISGRDPLQIAGVKGLAAGVVNLALGLALGQRLPSEAGSIALAGVVGLFAYGGSLALFVVGLRVLGSAKTAGLFAVSSPVAVVLAWRLLGEVPRWPALAGGGAMLAGVLLMAWLEMRRARRAEA